MKSKQAEIAILDGAIASLGPDSYLGPWLSDVRGLIEREIQGDILPSVSIWSPIKAAQQARDVVDDARAEASRIMEDGRKEALRLHGIGKADIERRKARLANDLRRVLREMEEA